ncbi:MAG: 7-cyano-7-deazaguanine synthase, partial [Archaeoglobaceae archaeon]
MNFDPNLYIEANIKSIRKILSPEESGKVLAACSGGVDSTVSAVLVARALGKPIKAVFIDDGLRRKGEPESVVKILKELGLDAFIYDAKKEVLGALKGKVDPEEKRKA